MKNTVTRPREAGPSLRRGPRWFRILLWVLLLLNMVMIFEFSSKDSVESTAASDAVLARPLEIFETIRPEHARDERVYWWFQFLVRKGAHMLEFACLCTWATGLLLSYGVRFAYPLGGGFAALYAASDEVHQLFVPGRSGQFTDWLIDCLGALAGLVLVWLVVRHIRRRRKERPIG